MGIVNEIHHSWRMRHFWLHLGIFDIRLRYRRSVLGPWWLTISTAIFIGALGFTWSAVFHANIKAYVPFFSIGSVVWNFLSLQINDACNLLLQFEHSIRQFRIPLSCYSLRLLTRHIIIFCHNFVIVLFVVTFIGPGWHLATLLALLGLCILFIFCLGVSFAVSILCTRYRDMIPIVANILQIAYFVTPILWQPSLLTERIWALNFNPLYHLIEVVRLPLLGQVPSAFHWTMASLSAIIAFVIGSWCVIVYQKHIAYWL